MTRWICQEFTLQAAMQPVIGTGTNVSIGNCIRTRGSAITSPILKYGLFAVVAVLWTNGLVDQFSSASSTGLYLGISGLMVAISAFRG